MTQRTKAQYERHRADILALLTEAEGAIRLDTIAATIHGLDIHTCPGYRWNQAVRHTSTDLRALTRAGKVIGRSRWGATQYAAEYADSTWTPAPEGTLTPAEEHADLDDVRRQMAGWEPAP